MDTTVIIEIGAVITSILGVVAAVSRPILKRIEDLREENTRQHEEGRVERANSEMRLQESISSVAASSERNREIIIDVRDRVSRVEGKQELFSDFVSSRLPRT